MRKATANFEVLREVGRESTRGIGRTVSQLGLRAVTTGIKLLDEGLRQPSYRQA